MLLLFGFANYTLRKNLNLFTIINPLRDIDSTLEHTHPGRETLSGKLCHSVRLHGVRVTKQLQKVKDIKYGKMRQY
jgi:hypothetical protein